MTHIREKLINTAINTIRTSGLMKLTIRELGKAVDIKSSSVMYHFKNKDALMSELVNVYTKEFFLHLEDINKNTSDAKDRIFKLVDIYEDSVNEEKFCLCGMLATQNDNLDEETKALTIVFFDYVQNWLQENLLLLKKDANFSKVILASLNGAMIIDNLKNNKINYLKETRNMIDSLI